MERVRRLSIALAAGVLLGGPAVLGYFKGGFFDEARLIAAVVAWLLVALAAVTAERPLPRTWPGRVAIGALALLTGWSALSLLWAPLGNAALADVERLALYTGVLIAAAAWLGTRWAARLVEPGLGLGAVAVVGYGMSERFLPHLIELPRSKLAFGRLEQPLTYWNAMGLLAALGLVLCARVAGSPSRPLPLRLAAAGASPLLGAGLLLTLSRGALAAVAFGFLLLLCLALEHAQTRAIVVVGSAAGAAALAATLLPGVDKVGRGASGGSGAVLLVLVIALGLAAAAAQWRLALAERDRRPRLDPVRRRWRLALIGVAALSVVVVAAAAIHSNGKIEREGSQTRSAQRLRSLESARFRYWDVALGSFASEPLVGKGTSSFPIELGRKVGRNATARDAHSLYFETAGELGLVGLALLGLMIAAVVAATRRSLALEPALAAGPAALLLAWAIHASIDWDWEMPGVTLFALVCAGLMLALAEPTAEASAGGSALRS